MLLDSVSILSSRLSRQYRAAVPIAWFLLDCFKTSSFPAVKQEVLSTYIIPLLTAHVKDASERLGWLQIGQHEL